jgi:putative ABC transport system permease protein
VRITGGPNPFWKSAPLLLVRYPGLLAALLVGALLLSLSAAAYPLLLSSTAGGLVRGEIAKPFVTRYGAGITYRRGPTSLGKHGHRQLWDRIGAAFETATAPSPSLASPIETVLGPDVSVAPVGSPAAVRPGQLFAGTAALRHVEVLEGRDGPGVWLPDLIADALRVGAGDRVTLGSNEAGPVEVTVDGVYEALYAEPRSGYWFSWIDEIYSDCTDCSPPPQFILVDRDQLLDLARVLRADHATFQWQAPVAGDAHLTLEEARDLAGFTDRFRERISDDRTLEGRLFDCCYRRRFLAHNLEGTRFTSALADVLDAVDRRMVVIGGPGRTLDVAAIVVALAVLAAAGASAVSARRTELRLLVSRGANPLRLGLRACLESVGPLLVGGAVGTALAFAVTSAVGGGDPSSGARWTAVGRALAASAGAVVVMGAVWALATVVHEHPRAARAGLLFRLPWEVALLGAAILAARDLGAGVGDAARRGAGLGGEIVALPLAAIAGIALLAARLLRGGLRRVRDRSGGMGPPGYLAVHRLAGATDVVMALFAAATLCLGVAVQGRGMARSLEDTVAAKARIFVGSDVHAAVQLDVAAPADFPLPVTKVFRAVQAGIVRPARTTVDILAVDPGTLPAAAYWNEGFADVPLEGIMARLETRDAGALPIALSGGDREAVRTLEIRGRSAAVRVVARPTAFPGAISDRPLVVADAEALRARFEEGADPLTGSNRSAELWVAGPDRAVRAALADLALPPTEVLTATEVEDVPYIQAAIGTFLVLNVLGLVTSVLLVAAILMYLQARQRSQVVAYGLSLRMGMGSGQHLRALAIELGAVLGSSYLLAIALAVGAVVVMVPLLDPLGSIPPAPLIVIPGAAIVVGLLALFVAVWLGAWAAARQARRASLAKVMRMEE